MAEPDYSSSEVTSDSDASESSYNPPTPPSRPKRPPKTKISKQTKQHSSHQRPKRHGVPSHEPLGGFGSALSCVCTTRRESEWRERRLLQMFRAADYDGLGEARNVELNELVKASDSVASLRLTRLMSEVF